MTISRRVRRWAGFQSVLCPVDFSDHSRRALQYAERIAVRSRGTLTVAYANDPLLIAAAAAALHDRRLVQRSAKELDAFVHDTLEPASLKRLRVQTQVSVGDPAAEILKIARRRRSDLIVLGTQGLTGATRLLMGSTTLRVLERTTRPVLAVPAVASPGAGVAGPSWPGGQVVAAVALDRDSPRDIASAAIMAEWFGCALTLLHVVNRIAAPAWFADQVSAHDEIRVSEAERQLNAFARVARRRVETTVRIVYGPIAEAIAELAAAERCGLVTTALRDKRGWFDAKRGSISYQVIAHAATPVLAYPSRWRPR